MKRSLIENPSTDTILDANHVNPLNRSYAQLFAEISSSLSTFNREELNAFIRDTREMSKEAKRLMSLECYHVSNRVPVEIWEAIFLSTRLSFVPNPIRSKPRMMVPTQIYFFIERDFKKLACVSKSWSKIVYEVVRTAFQNRKTTSNWVLSHFRDTEVLDLAGRHNTTINDTSLMHLTNLKELDLKDNKMITYRSVEKLTNLTKLSLESNTLVTKEAFKNLTNLQSLNLVSNREINSFSIKNPTRLNTLILDSSSRVNNIDLFPNLTSLEIDGEPGSEELDEENFMRKLSSIKLLTNLRSLDLFNCYPFQYSDLLKLPNLSTISIVDNDNFTDDILILMTNITSLDTSYSTIVTNKSIQKLTKLSTLNIDECEGVSDDGIKNLESLSFLKLNENISDEGIKKLTNLTILEFRNNNVISDEGIKNLTNLTSLDLYGNQNISDFGIKNLTNLTSLRYYDDTSISSDGKKNLIKLVTPKEDLF